MTLHFSVQCHHSSRGCCAVAMPPVFTLPGAMLDEVLTSVGTTRIHFLGRVLVNLSSCVVLNRFQALESVSALELKAHELLQQNGLLASKYSRQKSAHKGPGSNRLSLCIFLPKSI